MAKILYTDLFEYANDVAAQAAFVSNSGIPTNELQCYSESTIKQQGSYSLKAIAKGNVALSTDLLNEDCSDISDWTDGDAGTAVSEVDPAGQFRFDTNLGAAGNAYAYRYRDVGSLPNTFTFEIKLYHDSLGTRANDDDLEIYYRQVDEMFRVEFGTDGCFINDTGSGYTEVGTNLVKYGGSAEGQTWRFLVTFTGVTGNGTCDVYLKDSTHDYEKVGSAIPCSQEGAGTDGQLDIIQFGYTTDNMVAHIDYIKTDSGLNIPYPSLNDTLTKTLSDYLDYSIMDKISFQIRASRTGTNIQLQIHDTGGTTSTHNVNIASADVWQTESWDISAIAIVDRDTIDKIIIKITNADADNTIYIDNMYSEAMIEHSYPFIGG